MFVIDCPRHESKVLVFETRIRSLTNTDSGIELDVECWCGQHVIIHTGRDRPGHATGSRGHPDHRHLSEGGASRLVAGAQGSNL